MKEEIGKRITDIRHGLGMKKKEFANFLGVSAQYLSNVENGTNCLSVEKLIYISEKTNLSLDYILLGKSNTLNKEIINKISQINNKEIASALSVIKDVIDIIKSN